MGWGLGLRRQGELDTLPGAKGKVRPVHGQAKGFKLVKGRDRGKPPRRDAALARVEGKPPVNVAPDGHLVVLPGHGGIG